MSLLEYETARLSVSELLNFNTFRASFSIQNLKFVDQVLYENTVAMNEVGDYVITDSSLYGGSTGITIPALIPNNYDPPNTYGGLLYLIDVLNTTNDVSPLSPDAIIIPTDAQGSANITFNIPFKQAYNYNLYYQTLVGTHKNTLGFGVQQGTVYLISSFSIFSDLPLGDGLFQVSNPRTNTISSDFATVGSTLLSYNTIKIINPLGSTLVGEIGVYKNSSNAGLPISGGLTGVTGTLVSSYSTRNLSNAGAIIPIEHRGITFDTNQGDFYMAYHPDSSDTSISSLNYVAVPPIYPPLKVGYVDFSTSAFSFQVFATLKDISYNYTPLNAGDILGITGDSLISDEDLPVFLDNDGVPCATFLSYENTANTTIRLKKNNVLSNSFYTVPIAIRGDADFQGTVTTSNITNNGFELILSDFDYKDNLGKSIFDKNFYSDPTFGYIRLKGPNNYFSIIPVVEGLTTYTFIVNSSLPFESNPSLTYEFSYASGGATLELLPSTLEYNAYWRGVIEEEESLDLTVVSTDYINTGTNPTFSLTIRDFDYIDKFGNSIFDPAYKAIEIPYVTQGGNAFSSNTNTIASGGTPFTSSGVVYSSNFNPNTVSSPAGGTQWSVVYPSLQFQHDTYPYLPNATETGDLGVQYFGIVVGTDTYFILNSVITATNGTGDEFSGIVLSNEGPGSSSGYIKGLAIKITSTTRVSPPGTEPTRWAFNADMVPYPINQSTSGVIRLLAIDGNTTTLLDSKPYVDNVVDYTFTTTNIRSNYFIGFFDNTTNTLRSSLKEITYIPPKIFFSATNPEEFLGTFRQEKLTEALLTNFNYLVGSDSVITGATAYEYGNLRLMSGPTGSPSDTMLTEIQLVSGQNSYVFQTSVDIPSTAYLLFEAIKPSGENFYGDAYKFIQPLVITPPIYSGESGPTYFGGWTGGSATDVQHLQNSVSGETGPTASFEFNYMYKANASKTTIYQLIAQVNAPIETSQTITLNIPYNELSRMLVYQSAWGVNDPVTGLPLQGFIGGGTYGFPGATITDPGPGFNSQGIYYGPTGLSGPNVALLLGSVLDAVNMFNGPTLQTYPVLSNLDNRFTSSNGTQFKDDAGLTITSIFSIWNGMTFGTPGSTAKSLLSIIPSEAISSITNTGLTITALKNILVDIDTLTDPNGSYIPALSNIFAETAAYGRANSKNLITIDQVNNGGNPVAGFSAPPGPNGQTGGFAPSDTIASTWVSNGTNVYGVDFQPGDSLTLYVTYTFTKGRIYTLDPHVVTDLQTNYGFKVGNVASLTIGGVRIKLQKVNPDGSVDLSDPDLARDPGSGNQTRVFGIKLVASGDSSFSNTVFSS